MIMCGFGLRKTKPNKANSLTFSVVRTARTSLKKQSQFLKERNGVKSILAMSYEEFNGYRRQENKPNSKHVLSVVEWANCFRTGSKGSDLKKQSQFVIR